MKVKCIERERDKDFFSQELTMNFDFVTFLILEWKIRCCMVYKFLTVHSRSIYTHE